MSTQHTVVVDGKTVALDGEENLLQVARKAGCDIPTFCYHSELSVYGACRLCLVEVEGKGIVASCCTPPRPGQRIRTSTPLIREMRKINMELLLANHPMTCPTCSKNTLCKLQRLAHKLGVTEIRFRRTRPELPLDASSPAVTRDPNKCILCGDCVRVCKEVQTVGVLDFAHRGAAAVAGPAYGKALSDVECVHCGQCARVCPTGAIVPRSETAEVWQALDDPRKTVVAQIAPAVRAALAETFERAGGDATGARMVAALKRMGFDQVYDTCFAADLTVMEETHEFLERKRRGEWLPMFTSCCPAWVAFAEQYYPDLLPHLSTCRSPQQMFGAVARTILPPALNVAQEDLVVVSIMPCTAKKAEARRSGYRTDGAADVNHVLTTQELARMIEQANLRFADLDPAEFDMPFGQKSGAGLIFGSSGGVAEAVLRYAAWNLTGRAAEVGEFQSVRGEAGAREVTVAIGDLSLRVAVVHGLGQARRLMDACRKGECAYDLVEVMACPGGCVGGAGQPVCDDTAVRRSRAQQLYAGDRALENHSAQENPAVARCYAEVLGAVGGEKAHALLHTAHCSRRRTAESDLDLSDGAASAGRLPIRVCLGTSCYLRGADSLLQALLGYLKSAGLSDAVDVRAHFCFERCSEGPTVRIGQKTLHHCTFEALVRELDAFLAGVASTPPITNR